jgi:hypothetical protein
MITLEQKQKVLTALKSHTVTSVRANQKYKIPVIIDGEERLLTGIDIVDEADGYYAIIPKDGIIPRAIEHEHSYTTLKELEENNIIWGGIILNNSKDQNVYDHKSADGVEVSQRESIVTFGNKKVRFFNQKFFHYDDTWYEYKYSADEPQYTYGIIRVENMPFNPFEGKRNMKSFICSLNNLFYQRYCEPFMLFINKKFVSWNDIMVVFDCGTTYLLLYGEKYNYFDLRDAEIHMVILPFKVDYIGEESDDRFNMMYEITREYIQESMVINDDGSFTITSPGIDEIYRYRGMVYNVGAWLYQQLKYNALGKLSLQRKEKLRRFDVIKREYDLAGNIINTVYTKFNALDKDSYDTALYNQVTEGRTLFEFQDRAIFKFDSDGLLDYSSGVNTIALFDDITYFRRHYSNNTTAVVQDTHVRNILFRENFVVFRNGLFDPTCEMDISVHNVCTIDNPKKDNLDILVFYHLPIERIVTLLDKFDWDYIYEVSKNIIEKNLDVKNGVSAYVYDENGEVVNQFDQIDAIFSKSKFKFTPKMTSNVVFLNANDYERQIYLQMMAYYLDYQYTDDRLYEENYNEAMNTVMAFDPLLFSNLYHTNIDSKTYYGYEANESLLGVIDYENRKGLKIPRNKYEKHESYVLVFENGELIEEYSQMCVYPNFFFIPMDREFASQSRIEILYFNYIDNNEIGFYLTDYMVEHMQEAQSGDTKWYGTDIFNQFINPKDLKIFCKYPENIIVYNSLVKESSDIAFNVSYRDTEGDLYLIGDVVDECLNNTEDKCKLTAVSKRKFIYQRLCVENKSYRIILGSRFRYCDNPRQYMLFINGRRISEEYYYITIPKYTRPFWGMYLYTSRFVGPEDRIELFYLPEEFPNINDKLNLQITKSGYIQTRKENLEVPLDGRYYMIFANGKKIPADDIVPIDSHTIRLSKDQQTMKNIVVNRIYTDTMDEFSDYFKDESLSAYDTMTDYIINCLQLGTTELDKLFQVYEKMSDTEVDMNRRNVNRIAIINEIVRDFWVTSGYDYNTQPFVYDFISDDLIIKDENGNLIIPALDANQYINIIKNDTHLIYYYHNPNGNWFENGRVINALTFFWEYSTNLYGNKTIYEQMMAYSSDDDPSNLTKIDLGTDTREWAYNTSISSDMTFHFIGKTTSQIVDRVSHIKFADCVYVGTIDEDLLQDYSKDWTGVSAFIHNDSGGLDRVINKIDVITSNEEFKFTPKMTESVVFLNYDELQNMLYTFKDLCQPSPEVTLEGCTIGNNNYFVYACPKSYAYDGDDCLIEFIFPDLNSPDIMNHLTVGTTPVYTSGIYSLSTNNRLESLDRMEMILLDEISYTNKYGHEETYCVWRTNGFFTRLDDDCKFDITIRFKDHTKSYSFDYDETIRAIEVNENMDTEIIDMDIDELFGSSSSDSTVTPVDENVTPKPSKARSNNVVMIDDIKILNT